MAAFIMFAIAEQVPASRKRARVLNQEEKKKVDPKM